MLSTASTTTASTTTAGPTLASREDEFDYTRFVLRTDETYPPIDLTSAARVPDPAGVHEGDPGQLFACVLGIWTQFSTPMAGVAAMAGVLHGLLDRLDTAGIGTLYDADEDDLIRFITSNPDPGSQPSSEEMRLRRNVIHGTYLALEDAGVIETPPLLDVPQLIADARADQRGQHRDSPTAKRTRNSYDKQVHVRSATHDEILLIRLASRLVGTSRGQHLAAAAVAACTNTATTSEAPQILWEHRAGGQLRLTGRATPNGNTEADIAARTITLDPWSVGACDDWASERSAKRRIHPEDSMLYSGHQSLTSNSAGVSVDQQVRKALTRAGLANSRGLTAGSLRLWGAIKQATDAASVHAGAQRAGIRFATLHRLIHQLGDRAT